MHKGFLKAGAGCCALAVILGAMAAHALRQTLVQDVYVIFQTGVQYQIFHALALIVVGIIFKEFNMKSTIWAGRFFAAGIFLFSGSLYLLTYFKATGVAGLSAVGMLTPIGGGCFIAGWLCLLSSFAKKPGATSLRNR